MNGLAYYNEHDPKAAAWLRELIKAGHIAPGDVDERSIADVWPTDLAGYSQCHFFAGIGGWSLALRLAGWPDNRPVWTGSCPCQPFSCAGKQKGTSDSRHLWPKWLRLIAECGGLFGVPEIFGEQVASALGRQWLSGVRTSLETLGRRVWSADLCAAGIGSPHIRQRLFWMADANEDRRRSWSGIERGQESARGENGNHIERCCCVGGLADADGCQPRDGELQRGRRLLQQPADQATCRLEHTTSDGREQRRTETSGRSTPGGCGVGGLGNSEINGCEVRPHLHGELHGQGSGEGRESCWMGEPIQQGLEGHAGHGHNGSEPGRFDSAASRPIATAGSAGSWDRFDLIPCADGKTRRIESGTFPLAHGVSGRVGLLRGYGNAIVPQVAAEFIRAYLEVTNQ